MDIIFKNLMERKNCVHALKRKYPGLSDYVRDNIAVIKMLLCESPNFSFHNESFSAVFNSFTSALETESK